MSIMLTRERILKIIEEEKQKLKDDKCDSNKHNLGKSPDLIDRGLRVCCKKSSKEYHVTKKTDDGFVLSGPEGRKKVTTKELMNSYKLG